MPAKSQAQFRLMKAVENNPKLGKEKGISQKVAKEFSSNKSIKRLPKRVKAK